MSKGSAQTTASPRFKSYPQYKDSGVEWLGEVPGHWKIRKTTWLFAIGSGTTPPSEDLAYYGGDIPWVTTSELRESVVVTTEKTVTKEALRDLPSLRLHPKGSVAVAMYGATIGRLGILGTDATVNQACCVFSMPKGIDAAFWFFWLQMRRPYLISLGYGGGQPNLSQDLLRSVRVPTPPEEEQRAIVAFLDRETAKIDALVAKKERLIELLQEKRAALITRAVTKGLDPNVPMKDSGVGWLGEMPEHWEIQKTTWLFSIGSGTTPSSEDPAYYGGDIPWVTTSELRETVVVTTEKTVTKEALRDLPSLRLHPKGSVAVAMYGATIGRLGILGADATVNQACCVFSRPKGIDAAFWFFWLQMRRPYLISLGYGGGQPNLSQDLLRSVRVPTPPEEEQRAIVALLDSETAKLGALVAKVRDGIDRLKEYRTALISAAVTGKIDVREEVA